MTGTEDLRADPTPEQPVTDRLREPSTWAAIGAVLVALGLLTEEQVNALIENGEQVIIGLGALAAVAGGVLRERGR